MVFGIGGSSARPAGPAGMGGGVGSAQLEAATAELDMITDVYNRLVSSCHKKCISTHYGEPDLNKGESVCIDRCAVKFFAVNKAVGEQLQKVTGDAQGGGAATGSFF